MNLFRWSFNLQNKTDIRQSILSQRLGIVKDIRSAAAVSAANRLIDTTIFKNSHHIACYFAQDDEFDCSIIIKSIWRAKKNCYLPILSKQKTRTLEFGLYEHHTSLIRNKFYIPEPNTSQEISLDNLDLVLMPLVAFDLHGNRLGMGGGYYDKTFAFIQNKRIKKPFILGVAFEFQKIKYVPVDPWDVTMQGVLTERQLYLF